MSHRKVNAGDTFGRWTTVERDHSKSTGHNIAWVCECICGSRRSVWTSSLLSGASQSCGCLNREIVSRVLRERNWKHGLSETREYCSWSHMIRRCDDTTLKCYPNYGGRGIRVCEAWRADFLVFLRDMGPRPSPRHTLDRINNDGNYEPGNCRWATRAIQLTNRRNARLVTHCGRTQTITEWARELHIPRSTLAARVAQTGGIS
jgi:hypothetical protein